LAVAIGDFLDRRSDRRGRLWWRRGGRETASQRTNHWPAWCRAGGKGAMAHAQRERPNWGLALLMGPAMARSRRALRVLPLCRSLNACLGNRRGWVARWKHRQLLVGL